MTLDEEIETLEKDIIYLKESAYAIKKPSKAADTIEDKIYRKRVLLMWLKDYKRLRENEDGKLY